MGTLMGAVFMVLLPEAMEWLSSVLRGSAIDQALSLRNNIAFLREIAIGLVIVAVPDLRAGRARAPLAANQGLLEALPVLQLRSGRAETMQDLKQKPQERARVHESPFGYGARSPS